MPPRRKPYTKRVITKVLDTTVMKATYGFDLEGRSYLRLEFNNGMILQARAGTAQDRMRVFLTDLSKEKKYG